MSYEEKDALRANYNINAKNVAFVTTLKEQLDSGVYKQIVPLPWLTGLYQKKFGHKYSRWAADYNIINGETFLNAILPFVDLSWGSEQSILKEVNPHNVLSAKYRGYLPVDSEDDANQICDTLESWEKERAKYVEVMPFGLVRASEGKNRVSLYKQISRNIKAHVITKHYPAPDDFQLIKLKPYSDLWALKYIGTDRKVLRCLYKWQCIHEGLAILPYKHSVNLLEEYGVKYGRSKFCLRAPVYSKTAHDYVMSRVYVS